ncbi:hypothetical protein MJO28_003097 [Puccinia striiformis f. sp. tritici]|uniref:Uncharacterized protein n=1 Tax=Puccinia striiformis f. sp. tritici TaxID=168172 RepID=A0ACC0ERF9_9BASI|nr:hypothetical protein MJO28_003097 [Puccinia striiformis f. sp. tritici]
MTLPGIKVGDLKELDDLLFSYRKCLQKYWPEEPSQPNLHLTQHYSDIWPTPINSCMGSRTGEWNSSETSHK